LAGIDGYGTTITFGTSGFSANLISVDGPGLERGSIDITHMGTSNAMAYIAQALYDVGEISVTFEFNGADSPPISGATETITIDWAGATGSGSWSFSAFCTGYRPGASIGERMQATMTLKATGALSVA